MCLLQGQTDVIQNRHWELSTIERNRRRRIYLDQDTPSSSLREDDENQYLALTTVELLRQLYKQKEMDGNMIYESLKSKRLNPLEGSVVRDDIEYYIPQLITFLAFQKDLEDADLVEFLMRACELHFLFSHSCYFYLNSIGKVGEARIAEVESFVEDLFLPRMLIYKQSKLTGLELARCSNINIEVKQPTDKERESTLKYGTIEEDECSHEPVSTIQIPNYSKNGFMSTPDFWFDLVKIGNDLAHINPKIVGLKASLRDINRKLPAAVYIPFVRNSLRYYTVLNIDVDHARVFSTKERSPYSIYIEVFREEEQFIKVETKMPKKTKKKNQFYQLLLNRTVSRPITISRDENTLKLKVTRIHSLRQDSTNWARMKCQRSAINEDKTHVIPRNSFSVLGRQKVMRSFSEQDQKLGLSEIEEDGEKSDLNHSEMNEHSKTYIEQQVHMTMNQPSIVSEKPTEPYIDKYFDKPFVEVEAEIRSKSVFRKFKTWKLVNIMVKTGDNLKQEQFAMQLINQFDSIFKRQNIELLLRPYEVISIGPDSGILEMVTDTSSMGRVLKNMLKEKVPTLKQFFKYYFKSKEADAKKNFCRSLAAYSLVCYFLQVKDRHNDNILLHRQGYIVHIDFGFFLSNAPGKGIELEKKCPFKLMSNYVEVLGGSNSLLFMEFRALFEKGFRAALKYKHEIITLVKMMYSSHGQSMPCFTKGDIAITELQERFNPRTNDLTQHCQSLINQSLDNWRARWYDKVQYWLQGIFY